MPKAVVLCGKIASGKTVYAKKLAEQLDAVTLSVDDVVLSLFDECLGAKTAEIETKAIVYLLGLSLDILAKDISVVLDFGHGRKSDRVRILDFYCEHNIPCELHYLDVADDVRRNRLHHRNKLYQSINDGRRRYIISDDMLKKFDAAFEIPDENEIDVFV